MGMDGQNDGVDDGVRSPFDSGWGEVESYVTEYDRCVLDAIYAAEVIDFEPAPDQLAEIASTLCVRLRGLSGEARRGVVVVTVKSIVQRNDWLLPQVGTRAAEGHGTGSKVLLHFYPWDEEKYGPFEETEVPSLLRETLARTDFEKVADATPVNRSASRVASSKDAYVCLGCGKPFGSVKSLNLHRRNCKEV